MVINKPTKLHEKSVYPFNFGNIWIPFNLTILVEMIWMQEGRGVLTQIMFNDIGGGWVESPLFFIR